MNRLDRFMHPLLLAWGAVLGVIICVVSLAFLGAPNADAFLLLGVAMLIFVVWTRADQHKRYACSRSR